AKRPLEIEADVRKLSRQSLVAARRIHRNSRVEIGDLTVRRPGTGICASRVDEIVGTHTMRTIEAGESIDLTMLRRTASDAA
ncbi:MAG TPA: SAF domain-containing protein, partial [Tepidisphaeraceae bacterium]|nr:SAF domain-containing protein [Tepidisphaeraceae bacterium]